MLNEKNASHFHPKSLVGGTRGRHPWQIGPWKERHSQDVGGNNNWKSYASNTYAASQKQRYLPTRKHASKKNVPWGWYLVFNQNPNTQKEEMHSSFAHARKGRAQCQGLRIFLTQTTQRFLFAKDRHCRLLVHKKVCWRTLMARILNKHILVYVPFTTILLSTTHVVWRNTDTNDILAITSIYSYILHIHMAMGQNPGTPVNIPS